PHPCHPCRRYFLFLDPSEIYGCSPLLPAVPPLFLAAVVYQQLQPTAVILRQPPSPFSLLNDSRLHPRSLLYPRTAPFFPPCSCHRPTPPQPLTPLLSVATTDRTPLLSRCRNPHRTIAALFLPPLPVAVFTSPFCLADPTFLQIQRRPATLAIHYRSPCRTPAASSRRSSLSSPRSPVAISSSPPAILHLLPSATIAVVAT
ncbi:hypothetical protein B296_00033776, partial [Ensete ventricosum]